MLLTFYGYLNEGKGISNFIKILSNQIISELYKNGFQSFIINIDYKEIDDIKKLKIIILNNSENYHSKFHSKNINCLDDIELEFDIPHNSINHNYLHEIIIHELTHLYEFYKIITNNRELPLYNKIKKGLVQTIKQDKFDIFSYFRNLVYLTLDNELNARISQTYQLLDFKNIKDKAQLLNFLKTTHIWKKYKEIENFNPKNYTSDLIQFLGIDLTLILINEFNLELLKNELNFSFIKNINKEEDILLYFNLWKKRFKYKLKKHYIKLEKIVDEVIKN